MTPEQAKENLRQLTEQLQAHVKGCKPHQAVVSRELLIWFIEAANKTLAKKSPAGLEQALGLTKGPGRPKGSGKQFDLAREIFEMQILQGKSWLKIADEKQMDVRQLQRIFDRHSERVKAFYLEKLSASK